MTKECKFLNEEIREKYRKGTMNIVEYLIMMYHIAFCKTCYYKYIKDHKNLEFPDLRYPDESLLSLPATECCPELKILRTYAVDQSKLNPLVQRFIFYHMFFCPRCSAIVDEFIDGIVDKIIKEEEIELEKRGIEPLSEEWFISLFKLDTKEKLKKCKEECGLLETESLADFYLKMLRDIPSELWGDVDEDKILH